MSDRVTLQNAMSRALQMEDFSGFARGRCEVLRSLLANRIVTPERAALETMAEHDCHNVFECDGNALSTHFCAPCWARHVINQTQQQKDTTP